MASEKFSAKEAGYSIMALLPCDPEMNEARSHTYRCLAWSASKKTTPARRLWLGWCFQDPMDPRYVFLPTGHHTMIIYSMVGISNFFKKNSDKGSDRELTHPAGERKGSCILAVLHDNVLTSNHPAKPCPDVTSHAYKGVCQHLGQHSVTKAPQHTIVLLCFS